MSDYLRDPIASIQNRKIYQLKMVLINYIRMIMLMDYTHLATKVTDSPSSIVC